MHSIRHLKRADPRGDFRIAGKIEAILVEFLDGVERIGGAEQPLFLLRKMILSESQKEREAALEDLFPYVKAAIKNTLEAMDGMPVTIRLLDPPLHEFIGFLPVDILQKLDAVKAFEARQIIGCLLAQEAVA